MKNILRRLLGRPAQLVEKEPEAAYDLWSATYDHQPGNLIMDMDAELFSRFISGLDLRGKVVVDVGCGTGRHWPGILDQAPASLTGYDVSEGMLQCLREKFPDAGTEKIGEDGQLPLRGPSVDLLLSTLALGHIAGVEPALRTWSSAVKKGGYLLLTDFHPAALMRGAKRMFPYKKQSINVRSYVHPMETIERIAGENGLIIVKRDERRIDDSVKHYFVPVEARAAFEKQKGLPLVFGYLFRKA
jgi:ubiquinone/menaquinone biosynthesis C-methylase UbiE